MYKGQLVLFDGFSQFPELTPGDVYTVDDIKDDCIRLYGFEPWYDTYLFSPYCEGDCFQHFDKYGEKDKTLWYVPEVGENKVIRLRRINWLREGRLQQVDINDIQWYAGNKSKWNRVDEPDVNGLYCKCCDGKRVINADITYPGLLLDGITNYSGKRYRSMDGSHRIQKMVYYGYTHAPCYVFHIDDIINYFEPMNMYEWFSLQ